MTCDEFENRILAAEADQMSADVRAAGELHLAECAGCKNLARQLAQLDAELTRTVKVPVLPATFQNRLQERLRTEAAVIPKELRAERKRQLQADYETGLARLKWRLPASPASMINLGTAAVVVLAGLIIHRLANSAPGVQMNGTNPQVFLWLASVIFLAIGIAAAFPRRLRKIWSAI